MKAFILAAGFGTRLFPLTIDRTKPAIPFLGKPLVGYVAEYVAGFGITDVIVNLHHQPQSVINALGDGSHFGVTIEYTTEQPDILGTAGALDNARHLLRDEPFLVVNGKIITDINIREAIETHRRSGAAATMVLKRNAKREKFTIIETEGESVVGFGDLATPLTEDESAAGNHAPLMFTGIHILEPTVFDYIPQGGYSDIVPAFYKPAIADGERVVAHIAEGKWYELSTIPRYLDVSLAMLTGRDVFTGKGCSISSSASVKDSVIWDNVTIADEARLYRTVIADGVTIKAGEHFESVAIVRSETVRNCNEIPDKALKGYYQDDKYIVPLK